MKDQIRECITDHGHTVRGAARILHIPLKDFESKLSGEQAFSLDEAHQLAELTGTTIDSLFFEDLNADLIISIPSRGNLNGTLPLPLKKPQGVQIWHGPL